MPGVTSRTLARRGGLTGTQASSSLARSSSLVTSRRSTPESICERGKATPRDRPAGILSLLASISDSPPYSLTRTSTSCCPKFSSRAKACNRSGRTSFWPTLKAVMPTLAAEGSPILWYTGSRLPSENPRTSSKLPSLKMSSVAGMASATRTSLASSPLRPGLASPEATFSASRMSVGRGVGSIPSSAR